MAVYEYSVQKSVDGGETWAIYSKPLQTYDEAERVYLDEIGQLGKIHREGITIRTGLTDEEVLKRYHETKLLKFRKVRREIGRWEPM